MGLKFGHARVITCWSTHPCGAQFNYNLSVPRIRITSSSSCWRHGWAEFGERKTTIGGGGLDRVSRATVVRTVLSMVSAFFTSDRLPRPMWRNNDKRGYGTTTFTLSWRLRLNTATRVRRMTITRATAMSTGRKAHLYWRPLPRGTTL